MLTKEKVREMFIRRGFNLREVKSPDYTVVEHKGETVAFIYDDSVYIARNYPSLNSGQSQAYADTPKTTIQFISAMGLLEEAIDFLLDSPSRMDRETREKRAKVVRKYFQDRNDRKYAEKVLSQPIYDYEKLIKQLTKNKEENLQCC